MESSNHLNGAFPKSQTSRNKINFMKKYLLLTAFVLGLITVTNAQTKNLRFSAGGGLVFPSGSNEGHQKGYGLDVIAKKDISEKLEGFAQIGYNSFSGIIELPGFTASEIALNIKNNLIPILVGVNYKAGNFRPGIGVGYTTGSSSLYKSGYLASTDAITIKYKGFDGGLSFYTQIGYNLKKIDLVANYFSVASGGNVNGYGLKVFYNF